VGIGTVLADDPELTYRGTQRKARPLHRVVLDSRLRMPPTARVLRGAPGVPVIIFCRPDAPRTRHRILERLGAEIIPVPTGSNGLSLKRVLSELGRRDLLGVLVEGGSEVHWSFVAGKLLDKFYFLVAPLVLGGKKSVPAVGGDGYRKISQAPCFQITRTFRLAGDLALETFPPYSRSILSPWLPSASPPSGGRYPSPSSPRR
jgi:diaminohydroxyphosphoribosylaminopyrimidine deaminase/5-amino-6-(5-phosphoribosylamino)uracil reductase